MTNHSHQRRSIRLDGYDYTQNGAYYVTVVTAGREERLGTVMDGVMQINTLGQVVEREWRRLPSRFAGLVLGEFIVMPNHVHGILVLGGEERAQRDGSNARRSMESLRPYEDETGVGDHRPCVEKGSLGAVVRAWKSSTTLLYHRMRCGGTGDLWQRNFF